MMKTSLKKLFLSSSLLCSFLLSIAQLTEGTYFAKDNLKTGTCHDTEVKFKECHVTPKPNGGLYIVTSSHGKFDPDAAYSNIVFVAKSGSGDYISASMCNDAQLMAFGTDQFVVYKSSYDSKLSSEAGIAIYQVKEILSSAAMDKNKVFSKEDATNAVNKYWIAVHDKAKLKHDEELKEQANTLGKAAGKILFFNTNCFKEGEGKLMNPANQLSEYTLGDALCMMMVPKTATNMDNRNFKMNVFVAGKQVASVDYKNKYVSTTNNKNAFTLQLFGKFDEQSMEFNRLPEEFLTGLWNGNMLMILEKAGVKTGTSINLNFEFIDGTNNSTIASGALKVNVPADAFKGDNGICELPNVPFHDEAVEKKMISAFNAKFPGWTATAAYINSTDWQINRDNSIYAKPIVSKSIGARIKYKDKAGVSWIKMVDFTSRFDGTGYSDNYIISYEYEQPRIVHCNCIPAN